MPTVATSHYVYTRSGNRSFIFRYRTNSLENTMPDKQLFHTRMHFLYCNITRMHRLSPVTGWSENLFLYERHLVGVVARNTRVPYSNLPPRTCTVDSTSGPPSFSFDGFGAGGKSLASCHYQVVTKASIKTPYRYQVTPIGLKFRCWEIHGVPIDMAQWLSSSNVRDPPALSEADTPSPKHYHMKAKVMGILWHPIFSLQALMCI